MSVLSLCLSPSHWGCMEGCKETKWNMFLEKWDILYSEVSHEATFLEIRSKKSSWSNRTRNVSPILTLVNDFVFSTFPFLTLTQWGADQCELQCKRTWWTNILLLHSLCLISYSNVPVPGDGYAGLIARAQTTSRNTDTNYLSCTHTSA